MNIRSTEIQDKQFREAHVKSQVKVGIPQQIRLMRDRRGMSQTELAELAEKKQSVISRLEDPSYGSFTLKTLLDIASAFDVGLLVKFVPFTKLLRETSDFSPNELDPLGFEEELKLESEYKPVPAEAIVIEFPKGEQTGASGYDVFIGETGVNSLEMLQGLSLDHVTSQRIQNYAIQK